jgi:protein-tyrosine kinase
LFKTEKNMGLSAVLSGRIKPEHAALKVGSLLGLSVLPAGAMPPNPQELLSREAFSAMLTKYSESYDVIIIDTPPAEKSADAQTIAARAGAALLVARNHLTPVTNLQSLAAKLQYSNIAVVGSLLNGIQ